ncbi:MAG: hypothetical protein CSB44_05465 [Gammaproteobacteria bacterium]|nr:MAG: hypothetical protein CSB44_05465 [Gammaproteobacteria bacterium]PIE36677.1 MAG: hypothetical protein CSA54_03705 [Gammaproteobacteria bacterium]
MSFLDQAEKDELVRRIQEAESRTRGEIVTVIAGQSDGYRYIPLLWSALAALAVPGVYFLWLWAASDGWTLADEPSPAWLYTAQALVFLGLGMLFSLPAIRLWLIPKSVKFHRAARHAREQFFLQNLHLTQGNTGILIFVSVAEHYVEIIVDRGISEVIDDALWEETVQEFVGHVRAGNIATGFYNTIEHCRDILWNHFPAPDGRPDELPNHLVEV